MILVLGRTGLLAQALQSLCDRDGREVMFIGRGETDLSQPGAAREVVASHAPSCVINAAAYTAVDKAESERDAAYRLNEAMPREASMACKAGDIPFIHISTDYVFDGTGERPYRETASTHPINVYGESKLAGEQAVAASEARAAIIRTSWVMGPVARNFIATMLRLARQREEINVVADQWGRVTLADDLAQACLEISDDLVRRPEWGGAVFHVAGPRDITWAQFAELVMEEAERQKLATARIIPVSSEVFGAAALRPLDSRMDSTAYESRYGRRLRDFADVLPALVSRINALV